MEKPQQEKWTLEEPRGLLQQSKMIISFLEKEIQFRHLDCDGNFHRRQTGSSVVNGDDASHALLSVSLHLFV